MDRATSWRLIPGRCSRSSLDPAHVFHLAWNPRRPNLLAAGVEDNTIRIWDVDTGRQTLTLEGDSYNGLVVAFHPGGELLASRGWNSVLRLWDIRTGRQLLSMPSAWLPDLHFDRDGSRLSPTRRIGPSGDPRSVVSDRVPLTGPRTRAASSDLRALDVDPSGQSSGRVLTREESRSGTCPRNAARRFAGHSRSQACPVRSLQVDPDQSSPDLALADFPHRQVPGRLAPLNCFHPITRSMGSR